MELFFNFASHNTVACVEFSSPCVWVYWLLTFLSPFHHSLICSLLFSPGNMQNAFVLQSRFRCLETLASLFPQLSPFAISFRRKQQIHFQKTIATPIKLFKFMCGKNSTCAPRSTKNNVHSYGFIRFEVERRIWRVLIDIQNVSVVGWLLFVQHSLGWAWHFSAHCFNVAFVFCPMWLNNPCWMSRKQRLRLHVKH